MSSSTQAAPLRIFSYDEWSKLYSDSDSKAERGKAFPFHFMLARNPKEEAVIERIEKATDKLIVADKKQHNLTPLMIATMRGKTKIVEELLKKDLVKQHINDQDAYGWTALHHAALTSDEIFKQLIAAGAKPDCRTNLKGLPADLKALTTWEGAPYAPENITFEGKPLDQERAQANFGMTSYRGQSYFSPEYLLSLWQQEEFEDNPIANHAIEHSKCKRPQLIVSAIDKEKGFYGLSAGEDLLPGTIIGEYAGSHIEEEDGFQTFSSAEKKQHAYTLRNFDAQKVGNFTRFINCDFPNAAAIPYIENGIVKVFFVAFSPIKKGEPILFNYGAKAYEVTQGPQMFFNRSKMHDFFKKGLDAIKQEIVTANKRLDSCTSYEEAVPHYLNVLGLSDFAQFPLDNPLALIDLHVSGTIPAKEWLKKLIGLDKTLVLRWSTSHGLQAHVNTRMTLLWLHEIDSNIQTNAKEHYPLFQKWVQDHCQKVTIMDLTKAMQWIEEALVVKQDPSLINGIEDRLKSYDWTKDDTNLYSYKNRRAALASQIHFDVCRQLKGATEVVQKFFETRAETLDYSEKAWRTAKKNFSGSELEKMFTEMKGDVPQEKEQINYVMNTVRDFQKAANFL